MDSLQLAQLIVENPAIAAMGQNYPAMADALNAPTEVNNPDAGKTETVTTPAPIGLSDVWAQVPSAERVAVRNMAGFVQELRDAIAIQDRGAMAVLLEDAVTAGAVKPATAGKLQTLLAATVSATTTQPAKIPGPPIASERVDAAAIQGADIASGGLWYRGAA